MNFPLDTSTKRFTPCVIICPRDKWLPQQKCFKCEKEEHITKDYKGIQSMKKQKIQEKLNNKEDKKKDQGFGDDLE